MAGSGHVMHRAGGGISPEFGGTTAAIFPPPLEAEETWPMAAAGIFSGFFLRAECLTADAVRDKNF